MHKYFYSDLATTNITNLLTKIFLGVLLTITIFSVQKRITPYDFFFHRLKNNFYTFFFSGSKAILSLIQCKLTTNSSKSLILTFQTHLESHLEFL